MSGRATAGGARGAVPPLLRSPARLATILILTLAGLLIVPAALIVLVGMLPTMVVAVLDRRGERFVTMCIGALNFAGLFPWLLRSMASGHDVGSAMAMLADPMLYGSCLLGAGIGFWVHRLGPGVAARLLRLRTGARVAQLKKANASLLEEWGIAVTLDQIEETTLDLDRPLGADGTISPPPAENADETVPAAA